MKEPFMLIKTCENAPRTVAVMGGVEKTKGCYAFDNKSCILTTKERADTPLDNFPGLFRMRCYKDKLIKPCFIYPSRTGMTNTGIS